MILSNPQKKILYVSKRLVGKPHDYRMLMEEFPPKQEQCECEACAVGLFKL
jgi:hypothetical protein